MMKMDVYHSLQSGFPGGGIGVRVLISAIHFEKGRTFGAETYFQHMLAALDEELDSQEVYLHATRQTLDWVNGFTKKIKGIEHLPTRIGLLEKIRGKSVKKVVDKIQPDVVFFPFNTMSKVSRPSVLMLHDSVSFFYRKHYPRYEPIRNIVLSSLVKRSVKRATVVITPTEAIVNEARGIYGGNKKFIAVHEAANESRDIPSEESDLFGWSESNIVLMTGSKLPHKGQDVGIKGFCEFISNSEKQLVEDTRLVVTGCSAEDRKKLENYGDNELAKFRITLLDKVPSTEFQQLVNLSTVHLFPTYYEGYGLGVAEAQRAGKVVIASDLPVLREVSGGYAEFFEPGNFLALSVALKNVLADKEHSSSLVKQALVHSTCWSWQDHANKLLTIFREVARG